MKTKAASFKKSSAFTGSFKAFAKKPKAFKVPEPPAFKEPDTTPAEFDRVLRLLLDPKLTKRVMALQQQYPTASMPEMVVMDYLDRNQVGYIYQGSAFGGRSRRGGLVPDFVVPRDGSGLIIQVQGEYWHSVARKGWADKNVKVRLLNRWVSGVQVKAVVEVWETDLYYRKADTTMRLALAGQGMR